MLIVGQAGCSGYEGDGIGGAEFEGGVGRFGEREIDGDVGGRGERIGEPDAYLAGAGECPASKGLPYFFLYFS